MNLYEAKFKHYAPKGSQEGIKEYFLAANDEEAFKYINENHNYSKWEEIIEEIKEDEYYSLNEKKKMIDKFKKELFENKGDIDLDLSEFGVERGSGYDGYTRYGWNIIKENISDLETTTLKGLKIIE